MPSPCSTITLRAFSLRPWRAASVHVGTITSVAAAVIAAANVAVRLPCTSSSLRRPDPGERSALSCADPVAEVLRRHLHDRPAPSPGHRRAAGERAGGERRPRSSGRSTPPPRPMPSPARPAVPPRRAWASSSSRSRARRSRRPRTACSSPPASTRGGSRARRTRGSPSCARATATAMSRGGSAPLPVSAGGRGARPGRRPAPAGPARRLDRLPVPHRRGRPRRPQPPAARRRRAVVRDAVRPVRDGRRDRHGAAARRGDRARHRRRRRWATSPRTPTAAGSAWTGSTSGSTTSRTGDELDDDRGPHARARPRRPADLRLVDATRADAC